MGSKTPISWATNCSWALSSDWACQIIPLPSWTVQKEEFFEFRRPKLDLMTVNWSIRVYRWIPGLEQPNRIILRRMCEHNQESGTHHKHAKQIQIKFKPIIELQYYYTLHKPKGQLEPLILLEHTQYQETASLDTRDIGDQTCTKYGQCQKHSLCRLILSVFTLKRKRKATSSIMLARNSEI